LGIVLDAAPSSEGEPDPKFIAREQRVKAK
jgi:hypothetical protein